ncbi:MAG: metalloregulator ArsR/SmtB family transcription factor [Gemmataceae bacterium]
MKRQPPPGRCAAKLRILSDPTRLAVVELLMAGPKHVGELNRRIHVEQSLLSHHLRVLRQAGLVVAARDGKSVLYRLSAAAEAGHVEKGIDLGCCVIAFAKA